MASHQIRDLVHTIKSSDLTPAQIEAAFGEIYLSKDTIQNQMESQEIVQQFQTVKCPTYSASIPNTSVIANKPGDSGIIPVFLPTANKTYQLICADVENAGGSSATIVIGYTDGGSFVQLNSVSIAGGATGIFTLRNAYTFDSSVYPAFLVTSGTAADVTVNMVYSELVQ